MCADRDVLIRLMDSLNAKLSFTKYRPYFVLTGSSTCASHFAVACWGDPIIARIGRSGTSSLCTFATPYIRGRVDPTGRIFLYVLSEISPALCNLRSKVCMERSRLPVLSHSEQLPRRLNLLGSFRMSSIFRTYSTFFISTTPCPLSGLNMTMPPLFRKFLITLKCSASSENP